MLAVGCADRQPSATGYEAAAQAYRQHFEGGRSDGLLRYSFGRRGEFYVVGRPEDDGPSYYVRLAASSADSNVVKRAGAAVTDTEIIAELVEVASAFKRTGVAAALPRSGGGAVVYVSPQDALVWSGPVVVADSASFESDLRAVGPGWYHWPNVRVPGA